VCLISGMLTCQARRTSPRRGADMKERKARRTTWRRYARQADEKRDSIFLFLSLRFPRGAASGRLANVLRAVACSLCCCVASFTSAHLLNALRASTLAWQADVVLSRCLFHTTPHDFGLRTSLHTSLLSLPRIFLTCGLRMHLRRRAIFIKAGKMQKRTAPLLITYRRFFHLAIILAGE